ncbi:MAG: hypothetical protein Q9212_007113 [Teloschistes hypoglaucus]
MAVELMILEAAIMFQHHAPNARSTFHGAHEHGLDVAFSAGGLDGDVEGGSRERRYVAVSGVPDLAHEVRRVRSWVSRWVRRVERLFVEMAERRGSSLRLRSG